MEPEETYTADSGRRYKIIKKITPKVFTTISLDEEDQPTRVLKKFRKKNNGEVEFEEERKILTQLNQTNGGTGYPGVITLYDSGEKDFFLILEYSGEEH